MFTRLTVTVAIALSSAAVTSAATGSGSWGEPREIDDVAGNSDRINTREANEGCPILSPDGRSLYMASNRGGGKGGLDIWVSHRDDVDEPFGDPVNLEEINSAAADFCPTPLRGRRLLFVSNRDPGNNCGMGDIYIVRENPKHGWGTPRRLPCAPAGPNTELDEQGPSLVEIDGTEQLFYSSSNAPTVPGEIHVSTDFGPGTAVGELNGPANDIQPNVRKDGLEIVFSSNRFSGNQDIWTSSRATTSEPWSPPVPVTAVNTSAGETRPSLSWHADTLLFGRALGGEGGSDIYISSR